MFIKLVHPKDFDLHPDNTFTGVSYVPDNNGLVTDSFKFNLEEEAFNLKIDLYCLEIGVTILTIIDLLNYNAIPQGLPDFTISRNHIYNTSLPAAGTNLIKVTHTILYAPSGDYQVFYGGPNLAGGQIYF